MLDTIKIKAFIDSLLEEDAMKLRRGFGIGMYLFNQLREYAPPYLLDNLQTLDRLPLEKKKVILADVRKFLEEYEKAEAKSLTRAGQGDKPVYRFFAGIERLKFLTDKDEKLLRSLGIETVYDALLYVPFRYEDRRSPHTVKSARVGEKCLLKVKPLYVKPSSRPGYTAEVVAEDETGEIRFLFRYKKTDFLRYTFRRGSEVVVYGKVRSFRKQKYMVHPEVLSSDEYGSIVPVYYGRTKGELVRISSKTKQKRIRDTLSKIVRKVAPLARDYMPEVLIKKYGFPSFTDSIISVHLPDKVSVADLNAFSDPYHRRLIYDDLFLFQLALLVKKRESLEEKAPVIDVMPQSFIAEFERELPFKLTDAQRRSLREILENLREPNPMNRLLQGDVGSGKTVVAMGAALACVRSGYQVAVMVPTEILAHQHFKKFREFFEGRRITVGLLTGSMTQSEKTSAYRHIRDGNIQIVVGTHALIQDRVEFKRLGLVIIDEQHRFGVMQRKILLEKGGGLYPHCLVMSATPIPRTLALSLYGDLDISVIDELPPGRQKVRTSIVYESERDRLLQAIEREVKLGNKVYIIYPLIEESEKLDLRSAVEEFERWRKELPDMEVFLLHGRMSDDEKREVMERFKDKGDVLVSTTVIEVGIDVPEATLMIIESAHRFGLSQIHQLRGRVGRSDRQSYCYLVVPDSIRSPGNEALRRLMVLVRTNDGFEVAEKDLAFRGPGELLGVSQSGYFGFSVANLARSHDRKVLVNAREDALRILEEDPKLEKYPDLKGLLIKKYGDRLDLSYIA